MAKRWDPAARLMVTAVIGIAFVGCDGEAPARVTPVRVSETPAASGPFDLTVTVQGGGDCREIDDRWEVRGGPLSGPGDTEPLGVASPPTSVQPDLPGIVPCAFAFTVGELPAARAYYVVDRTLDRGWGPWTLAEMRNRDWQVTVSITDLD